MKIKLGTILMYASDLVQTERYYSILLRQKPSFSNQDVVMFDVGGQELLFHQDPHEFSGLLAGLEKESVRGKGIIIHFIVEDINSEYERLIGEGFQISMGPTSQSFGRRQIYLYDCNGYNVVVEQIMA